MGKSGTTMTYVEAQLARRRRWWWPVGLLLVLATIAGLILFVVGGALFWNYGRTGDSTPAFADQAEHFKYGSIGSEVPSGIPYWAWQALPRLFPEEFAGRTDYAAFGFLYERDAEGRQRDLPIGVSRRSYRGIEMVWLNCSVCHAGTWRADAASPPRVVPGMPSNNLDFGGFIRFLLDRAATDPRLTPASLVNAAEQAGARFGPIERQLWLNAVGPQLREGLLERRFRLLPLLDRQPLWGPGRVDTFNPYKLLQLHTPFNRLAPGEMAGQSDFPSIFYQGPREGMQLHWDGNNTSLMERNLSAAIGAGVTPDTVGFDSIRRIASWLQQLRPPPSPHQPDPAAVRRGAALYAQACASCHGWQGRDGYVFRGNALGRVTPIAAVGTDRGRLDSYTEAFRVRQREIFAGTPYEFTHFTKTAGYANAPLDGLWLRGPYLHNGSVPTLAALLLPPAQRPVSFLRGLDIVDFVNGGFLAPACDPAAPRPQLTNGRRLLCYDTRLPGNGNGGHLWGTDLPPAARGDLLAYLLTF
jgi:mono/diheme cytochrome c family protein